MLNKLGIIGILSFSILGLLEINNIYTQGKQLEAKAYISINNTDTHLIDTEVVLAKSTNILEVSTLGIKELDKVHTDMISYTMVSMQEERVVGNSLAYIDIGDTLGSAEETDDVKYYRIFGERGAGLRGKALYYSTPEEALKDMVTFKIKVWALTEDNEWYTREVSMTSHKNIYKTIIAIYNELYMLEEEDRLPINTIGSYNYRDGYSNHSCGVAIDMNWVENAEMTNEGVVTAGEYWKPYDDIHSIRPNSKVVSIFAKYGFGWGGDWYTKKDYMHFSYFDR